MKNSKFKFYVIPGISSLNIQIDEKLQILLNRCKNILLLKISSSYLEKWIAEVEKTDFGCFWCETNGARGFWTCPYIIQPFPLSSSSMLPCRLMNSLRSEHRIGDSHLILQAPGEKSFSVVVSGNSIRVIVTKHSIPSTRVFAVGWNGGIKIPESHDLELCCFFKGRYGFRECCIETWFRSFRSVSFSGGVCVKQSKTHISHSNLCSNNSRV